MFRPRDWFFPCAEEPAQETDPGERRNHALLPGAEGFSLFWSTQKRIFVQAHPRRKIACERKMEILYPRCAGLDVHKKTIKVCLLIRQGNGQPQKEFRTYGTTTHELLELADWLKEQDCTHVAFETTGVSWKPVYNLLEGAFDLLVVNAQHMKAVPGRKTDVRDAEWIADLLQHGLLKASFIPSAPQRELRELTRYRVRLTEERAREVNRLQKTLEDTNLKLGDVVSDIMGKASRMTLQAIVDGETDPAQLAAFALGRVRATQEKRRKVCVWRDHSTPLNYARIVLRLEEIGEMALDGMSGRVRADFPARLCREVASYTQERVRLVLTKPDDGDALEIHTDAEKQVLPVQFGRTSYGMLIFSLCQQEPALREQELEGTRSLARTCAGLLRHFELASLVFNGSPFTAVSLTRRQRDVLQLICQGCTLPAIVRQLQIARDTAEKHRRQVYDVLRAKNDLEVRLNAYRAGLFSPLSSTPDIPDQDVP
jgi:DNA-binding CsgD family transcriptional regulator